MSDEILRRWPETSRLLDDLLALDEDARRQRIASLAARDPELAPLLHALAADTAASDEPRAALPLDLAFDDPDGSDEIDALGDRVGPYRLVQQLGRGGMARVFRAEDTRDPAARHVALKLLDVDGWSPAAQRRFAREQQTLARLQHPHIARWLEAGVTSEGRPYLAIELIDGLPLDRHCDAGSLSIDRRLELFVQICSAVDYAHGQSIVHRDLKPSNVLVDRDGCVRLLDFGIAKWLTAVDGEDISRTGTLMRLMTPSYAAPEQLDGGAITPAIDVYQLGLLLFELLTGQRAVPLFQDGQRRRSAPPYPSRIVLDETLAPRDELARRATVRATTPRALARRLARDLDEIVMRATRRSPGERHPSAAALRHDIETVLAGRRTADQRRWWNAPRRYARRHPVRVAVAGAVGLALLTGAVAFALQARETARERDRARHAEARLSAINDFLVHELLTAPTPENSRDGRPPGVEEVLARAAQTVGPSLRGQPEVEAAVRETLARAYAALGRFAPAREQAQAADAMLARQPAEGAARQRSRALLASIALEAGRIADAQSMLPAIVAAQTAALGPGHPDTLASRALLGAALRENGQPSAAADELTSALDAARSLPADAWRVRARLSTELILAELILSRGLQAETHARALVDLVKARVGPDHPEHAAALRLLARAFTVLLKYSDAVTAQEHVVTWHERLYGPSHPATGSAWLSLGTAYSRFNRDQDAARANTKAHTILSATLGPNHPDTILALRNMGVAFKYAGDLRAAERCYREVLAIRQRTLGPLNRNTLEAASLVQLNMVDQGRLPEARTLGRELLNRYEAVLQAGPVEPLLLDDYALHLFQIGPPELRNPAKAVAMAERAVEATRRADYARLRTLAQAQQAAGRDRDALATAREALALPAALQSWTLEQIVVDILSTLGMAAEKEAFLRDRLTQFTRLGRPDDFLAGNTLRHLAETMLAMGRPAEAEQRYRDALAQFRKTSPDSHWQIGRVKSSLGEVLLRRRAYAEAETLLLEGYRTLIADRVVRRRYKENAKARLVDLYTAMGRAADAERWRREVLPAQPID